MLDSKYLEQERVTGQSSLCSGIRSLGRHGLRCGCFRSATATLEDYAELFCCNTVQDYLRETLERLQLLIRIYSMTCECRHMCNYLFTGLGGHVNPRPRRMLRHERQNIRSFAPRRRGCTPTESIARLDGGDSRSIKVLYGSVSDTKEAKHHRLLPTQENP